MCSNNAISGVQSTSPSPAVWASGAPGSALQLLRRLFLVETTVVVNPTLVRHGDIDVVVGLAELKWEDDCTVDRDWKAAVATAEHHCADDEFGERVECAGEREISLMA